MPHSLPGASPRQGMGRANFSMPQDPELSASQTIVVNNMGPRSSLHGDPNILGAKFPET